MSQWSVHCACDLTSMSCAIVLPGVIRVAECKCIAHTAVVLASQSHALEGGGNGTARVSLDKASNALKVTVEEEEVELQKS